MAVTVTVTDNGSYHRVNLTGTGTITLEDLYQDLFSQAGNAETYMTKTGSGPYVYLYKLQPGENYVQMYVQNNVHFHMDSQSDELRWEYHPTTTSVYTLFQTYVGSVFEMSAGCILDVNGNDATYHRAYIYLYGRLLISGVSGNPCEIKNHRSMFVYPTTDDATKYNHVQHLKITSGNYVTGNSVSFSPYSTARSAVPHIYEDIEFVDHDLGLKYGAPSLSIGDYFGMTFRRWTFTDIRDVYINGTSNLYLEDFIFTRVWNLINTTRAGVASPFNAYNTSRDDIWKTPDNAQAFMHFKNCTFTDNNRSSSTEYGVAGYYGSYLYFEDCTFQGVEDQLRYGIYLEHGSVVLLKDCTFTNVQDRFRILNEGAVLHVRSLDLVIQGAEGVIENATVVVKQLEGKESHKFTTNALGRITTANGKLPVFCEMEQIDNSTTENWSDGTGDKKHMIEVFAAGYKVHQEEVLFTQDRTITITLKNDAGEPTSGFYGGF